ncbi:LolA family protein [Pseudonocardia sp. GCM10023141]|uniref:LolA family protein n=1 Tax=Pseudonocardia sp. GCM10023141 TaxID=3252653 RepID=UPI003617FC8A
MGMRVSGRAGRTAAAGIAVAGIVGLGLIAIPAGAGAAPALPPVSAEDLVSSVLAAHPGPFGGTVTITNALGLPALPNLPQAANGSSTVRVWSDGDGRGRLQLPTASGEQSFVADGQTLWSWNSDGKKVTKAPEGKDKIAPEAAAANPAEAAVTALGALQATSQIRVDGTAEVAGHAAYELVLAPAPSERTLLREVRIAVDAEKRTPLRLTVLANGSTTPALQIGFTDLTFGAQDPALFTFTPPPGATVEEPKAPAGAPAGKPEKVGGAEPTAVGDGWDTVLVAKMPAQDATKSPAPEGARPGGAMPNLAALGTPVSGTWGKGTLISTAVGSAIITDDGRIAVGAVPEQVLTEALAK